MYSIKVYSTDHIFSFLMDQSYFKELFEKYFILLEFDQDNFDTIINRYVTVLDHIFRDNIYNRGRFYIADYFAVYIANRVSHVENYRLLHALRARLDKKWSTRSK
jgi:hypothetical protein